MKLRDKIIKSMTEVYSDPERLSDAKINITITLSFTILISGILIYVARVEDGMEYSKISLITAPVGLLIFTLMFFMFATFMALDPSTRLRQHWHYLLNLNPIGRKKRLAEINQYISEQKVNIIKINYFFDDEKFKIISKYNLKEWIDTYIAKESSIHNLINQRVINGNLISMGLIYWSQLIPKNKLKVDSLRSVLMSCQITEEDNIELDQAVVNKIESMFKLYQEKDIILLFTSPYKVSDYLKLLELSQYLEVEFAVKSSIRELMIWAKNMIRAQVGGQFEFKRDKLWINALEKYESESIGRFVHLNNLSDIEKWGYLLSNCLKDYLKYSPSLHSGRMHIFGVYRNNKPLMCVKVNGEGCFYEAKKKGNKELTADELSEVLKVLQKIKE